MANKEPLIVDSALLEQAEQFCNRKLESDTGNRDVLRSLAEVYRKQGRLNDAANVYGRLIELNPDDEETRFLHDTLAGWSSAPPPSGVHPAPFVYVKEFLPRDFHDSLLPLLTSVREQMVPIVDAGEYVRETRQAFEYRGKWDRRRFRDAFMEIFRRVVPQLHLRSFEMGGLELFVRAYQDGHFFRVHRDAPPNSRFATRVVNFVYYFHRIPRPYTGGDLLIFDSDPDADTFTKSRFTRIVPEDNAMVIFPCNYYHCVIPVRCPSLEFEDSRFVINGHVRERMEASSAVNDVV